MGDREPTRWQHNRIILNEMKCTFDIIALTETWLNTGNINDYSIEGYDNYHSVREDRIGGGVALYIKTGFQCKVLKDFSLSLDNCLECLTVELCVPGKKNIRICVAYRQPGTNIDDFIETIVKVFDNSCNSKMCYLCGDINIDLLKYENHKGTRDFLNALFSLGMFPLIDRPSRITEYSATLIDNIFSNNLYERISNGLLINDISDHLPVFSITKEIQKAVNKTRYMFKRNTTPDAISLFCHDLEQQNWDSVIQTDDGNQSYNSFIDIIQTLFNKNCPVKRIIIKNNKYDKPWITPGLKNACKKKNTLYRRFLKCRSKEAEDRYKSYKNKLTGILRYCEKDYYNKKLQLYSYDMKNTWKLLNEVINRKMKQRNFVSHFNYNNNEIYDKQEIANGFNDFFVNIGPELANKIVIPENNDILQYMNDRNVNSMFLHGVNKKEMLDVIKSFANKTSTDYNGMNMFILKKITNFIVDPFLHVCNISFSKGVFPDALKIARVIPLFKSGDKHMFTNYRPVSLLPQFSKILEKIFNNRLDSFIEKNCILNECQYGFRNSRSTYMALMDLIENICESIDKKKYVMGIFIDLKKAFDTIDHNILLNKLYHYGIRGISNDWIKSYLENRKQFVQYDDAISDYKEILCGVPQGSI